jgi:hypothetical protein
MRNSAIFAPSYAAANTGRNFAITTATIALAGLAEKGFDIAEFMYANGSYEF